MPERELIAPEPIEESTYEMTPEEIINHHIDTVPQDLYGSLRALSKDETIKSVLGKETFERYYDIKMKEWDEFRIHVSDWERERYMETY